MVRSAAELIGDFSRAVEALDGLITNDLFMGSCSVVQRKTLRLIRDQTDTNLHVTELQVQERRIAGVKET